MIMEGYTLRQISETKGMPNKSTICRWLASDNKEFQDQYAHAKEFQADMMAEEIIDIADDGANDWEERESKNGNTFIALNGEHFGRSKIRIEARKWLMGKMKPKKYGDRQIIAGDKDNPIAIVPALNIFENTPNDTTGSGRLI